MATAIKKTLGCGVVSHKGVAQFRLESQVELIQEIILVREVREQSAFGDAGKLGNLHRRRA